MLRDLGPGDGAATPNQQSHARDDSFRDNCLHQKVRGAGPVQVRKLRERGDMTAKQRQVSRKKGSQLGQTLLRVVMR